MRRSSAPHALVACTLSSVLSACVVEDADQPDPDDFATAEDAIRGGAEVDGHSGLVQLSTPGGCTGFMLNQFVILTAGHCLPDDHETHSATISYHDPFRGKVEMFSGLIDYDFTSGVQIARQPGYDRDADPNVNDFAYIYNPNGWPDTNYHDWLRIFDSGAVSTVRIWGNGRDAYDSEGGGGYGILRSHEFDIGSMDDVGLVTYGTADFNVCKGDSGGPNIAEGLGMDFVAAVMNSARGADADGCSYDGGEQYSARISRTRLDWVESATGTSCTTMRASNGYDYDRCFPLPYFHDVKEEGAAARIAVLGTALY